MLAGLFAVTDDVEARVGLTLGRQGLRVELAFEQFVALKLPR